jgi:hypothetical protein
MMIGSKVMPTFEKYYFLFFVAWPWSDFYQIYGMSCVQPDETNVKKRA